MTRLFFLYRFLNGLLGPSAAETAKTVGIRCEDGKLLGHHCAEAALVLIFIR